MSEVIYSVNGKLFKEYGMYISDSEGLFDALKRKKLLAYEWPEYNGVSINLENPKFEERTIALKGFVVGDNWLDMKNKFDVIIKEFQQPGTQRLMIEPFGIKPLLYEVFLYEDVKLTKSFREGKMVGVFSIKLVEPNPLKIVYFTDLEIVNIAFSSNYETEVFWGDGTKSIFSSNVSEIKNYAFPSYNSSGYSIISTSNVNVNYYQLGFISSSTKYYEFSVKVNIPTVKDLILYVIGKKADNTLELIAQSVEKTGAVGQNLLKVVSSVNSSNYSKIYYKVLDGDGNEIAGSSLSSPRIEKVQQMGIWQDMTEKRKYIIVAGNIEQITNLSTNAELLWTKL